MPPLTLEQDLATQRQKLSALRLTLHDVLASALTTKQDLDARALAGEQVSFAALDQARANAASLLTQLNATERGIRDKERALVASRGNELTLESLDPKVPLVLLPVRLEYRFYALDQSMLELRLRIYPDEIHVDSHQPGLSAEEHAEGVRYWEARNQASANDAEPVVLSFARLCEQFGGPRSRFIVQTLEAGGDAARPIIDGYARPALATALPDRWAVIGYTDTWNARLFTHHTAPISSDLPLGFGSDPTLASVGPLDAEGAWLTDFEAAEALGMAMRVRLDRATAHRLKRIIVTGVRTTDDAQRSGERLEELIRHHELTSGTELLDPLTPTNNTSSVRSPYGRSVEPSVDHAALLGSTLGADSDAARLSQALGVSADCLGRLRGATRETELLARSANGALWPATWGFLFNTVLKQSGSDIFDENRIGKIDKVRRHFTDYVRSYGPFSPVRIGSQPYGILPVIDLVSAEASSDADDKLLAQYLNKLLLYWYQSLPNVPRLGKGQDPQQDFIDTLSMVPSSRSLFRMRNVQQTRDPQKDERLSRTDPRKRLDVWCDPVAVCAQREPSALSWVTASEVKRAEPLPEAQNFIRSLLYPVTLADLREHRVAGADTLSALYVLLRRGALLEYKTYGWSMAIVENRCAQGNRAPLPHPGVHPNTADKELWEAFERKPPSWSYVEGRLLAERPETFSTDRGSFADFRRGTLALSQLNVAAIEDLMASTLDLCSHRYDAWATSLATKRLLGARAQGVQGVYIGGYGCLEDIEVPRVPSTPGSDGLKPQVDPQNAGHIHAPSIAQAKSAAVLHSGYRAANEASSDGAASQALALQLPSARVRLARQILDGVRQGQALGALLGYRVERAISDYDKAHVGSSFNRHILTLRTAFSVTLSHEGVKTQGTSIGLDGLALHRAYEEGQLSGAALAAIDGMRGSIDVLSLLADAIDAVTDLLTAEGVHHAVNGNLTKSGAVFDAMADGSYQIPECDVVATHAPGISVQHRVCVLLPTGLTAASASARALAQPELDRWAGKLLGSPAEVEVLAQLPKTETLEAHEQRVTLADLGLCPLDIVYLSSASEGTSTLEQLLRYTLWQRVPNELRTGRTQGDIILAVTKARAPNDHATTNGAGTILSDWLSCAEALRRVLMRARPLRSEDLTPLVTNSNGNEHTDSWLAPRADELKGRIMAIIQDLEAQDALRRARGVVQAAAVTGFVPPDTIEEAQASVSYLSTLRERLAGFELAGADAAGAIRAVFGREFVVLQSLHASPVAQLFATAGTRPSGAEPEKVTDWLQSYARVRSSLEPLDTLLMLQEVFIGRPELAVAQLPHVPNSRWVGGSLPTPETRPELSIVGYEALDLAPGSPVQGLYIDGWSEVIPSTETTTGLTFHYDQPDARAPQAILLAMHPLAGATPWDMTLLSQTVAMSLLLAKIRAVDPDTLEKVGTYLPAIYYTENPQDP